MQDYGYIGKRIIEIIAEKKISQKDFARSMGVYPSTASQWIYQSHIEKAREIK